MTPELSTADLTAAAQARRENQRDAATADASSRTPESAADGDRPIALFSEQQVKDLRARWDQIQAAFVDEPRGAVEKADGLVADAIAQLAEGFARTRADLDHQWKRGDNVSTEDLRIALRRYRSFFSRLLEA
jgi:hypothetical protein